MARRPIRVVLDLDMVCMRCGHMGMLIVGHTDKLWEDSALCINACRMAPWSCAKCAGSKVPEHTRWCTTEHPEVFAAHQRYLAPVQLRTVLRLLRQLDPELIDEDPKSDRGAADDVRAAFDDDPVDDVGALGDPLEEGRA